MKNSNSKHTPGPWEYTKKTKGYSWIGARPKETAAYEAGFLIEICTINEHSRRGPTAMDNANAALITAAPELLEALEILMAVSPNTKDGAIGMALTNAAAVVQKARGSK